MRLISQVGRFGDILTMYQNLSLFTLPATLPLEPHGEAIKLDSKVLEEYTGRYILKGNV